MYFWTVLHKVFETNKQLLIEKTDMCYWTFKALVTNYPQSYIVAYYVLYSNYIIYY